jgi:hypothetical protein
MTRVLSVLASIAALAVTAGPAAAGSSPPPQPTHTGQVVVLIGANNYGLVAGPAVNAMFFPWDMP